MIETLGPGHWVAFCRLILRDYWERLWIIQELAVAGENLKVMCGQDVVPWNYFVYFGILFDCDPQPFLDAILEDFQLCETPITGVYSVIYRIKKLEHIVRKAKLFAASPLLELMHIGSAAKATDDRDKIFGLLGLMD